MRMIIVLMLATITGYAQVDTLQATHHKAVIGGYEYNEMESETQVYWDKEAGIISTSLSTSGEYYVVCSDTFPDGSILIKAVYGGLIDYSISYRKGSDSHVMIFTRDNSEITWTLE